MALAGCRSTTVPQTAASAPPTYAENRRFDELFLEAVRQKEKGNRDAQYELLRGALAVKPDAPEALYETALLTLSAAGSDSLRRAEGEELLRRAVALAPKNKYYKLRLANHYAQRADYKRAIELYEQLTAQHGESDRLSMLTRLYEADNNFEGAIRTLNRLETIEGRSEATSMEKYQIYTQLGDAEQAFKAIEDLCAEFPTDLRYRVLLGDLYMQGGHEAIALATYRDVLAAEPNNGYAQMSLLAYYKTTGQEALYFDLLQQMVRNPNADSEAKTEALRSFAVDNLRRHGDSTVVLRLFKEALEQPQVDRSLAELCAGYIAELKMPEDSLAPVLLKILDVEPDYTKARLSLLRVYLKRSDEDAILRTCREGTLYDPAQAVFAYYEGLVHYRRGQEQTTLATLRRGAAHIDATTNREVASDLYAMMGDLLHEMGRNDEAYAAYDSALVYNKANVMCLNNYAYFLSVAGVRLDDAERMSRHTIEAEPKNTTFLDTYAWILFQQKQYEQARIYIDETLRNAAEAELDATLYEHAGDIYFRCNERAAALTFWQRALRLSKKAEQKAALRRKLQRKRL